MTLSDARKVLIAVMAWIWAMIAVYFAFSGETIESMISLILAFQMTQVEP